MTDDFNPMAAVRSNWRLLPLLALVGALVVGGLYSARAVTYTSSAELLYSHEDVTEGLTGMPAGFGAGDPERTLATQQDIVFSDAVVAPVLKAFRMSRVELLDALEVTTVTGSDVLTVSATDVSAEKANRLATAVVDAYVAYSKRLGVRQLQAQADALSPLVSTLQPQASARPRQTDVAGQARVQAAATQLATLVQRQQTLRAAAATYPGQVSVIAAPETPRRPSSPSWKMGAALGALAGLVLGVLASLLKGVGGRRRRDERRGDAPAVEPLPEALDDESRLRRRAGVGH